MTFITPHEVITLVTSGEIKCQEDIRRVCEFIDPTEDHSASITALIAHKIIKDSRGWHKEIRHWEKVRLVSNKIGGFPTSARELVPMCAANWKVDIKINGSVTRGGQDYFASSFVRDVRMFCADPLTEFGFSKIEIDDAVSLFKEQTIFEQKQRLIQLIAYSREAEIASADDWKHIEYCFPSQEPGFAVAAVRKFMYQVKRKMLGEKVFDHLMVIITGRQGSGKTTLLEKMCEPLADVTAETDFDGLADKANTDLWGNFILRLPEMQKAAKADIASIKAAITEPSFSTRRLYTNESDKVKRNTTLIGDANETVDMLLNDSTGMRRFVELLFRTEDYKSAWGGINNLDAVRLWQSVNPYGPDPMQTFTEQLKTKQEEMRVLHPVEEWLADTDRDDYRVSRRYIDSDGRWAEKQFPVWRAGGEKQARDLYLENFKPWYEHNKSRAHMVTDNTFYKQMNVILRDGGDKKYGLRTKMKDGRRYWAWS